MKDLCQYINVGKYNMDKELEESLEQISSLVKGKRIVEIAHENPIIGLEDRLCDIDIGGGECYIVLDDGSVIKIWNSEWGGISLVRKAKKINKE